jgi:hypothetical protein
VAARLKGISGLRDLWRGNSWLRINKQFESLNKQWTEWYGTKKMGSRREARSTKMHLGHVDHAAMTIPVNIAPHTKLPAGI